MRSNKVVKKYKQKINWLAEVYDLKPLHLLY